MWKFWERDGNSNVRIILDIGSASVGGALVRFGESRPRILFTTREPILFTEQADHVRLFNLMLAAVEEVVIKIERVVHSQEPGQGSKRPEHIDCVLASPWYTAATLSLRESRGSPFLIDKEYLAGKITSMEKTFEEGLANAPFTADYKDRLAIIEQKIIKTTLNGYETEHPLGKRVTAIDMAVYVSVANASLTDRLGHIASRAFHSVPISFHSFSLIAFTTLRDIFPEYNDFLFVDVNGEETEVTVVKRGVALKNVAFPSGKNLLLRDIKIAMPEMPRGVLLSSLQSAPEIGKVLTSVKAKWQEAFRGTLSKLSEEMLLPHSMFLMADDDVMKIFSDFIQSGSFSELTLMSVPFTIIPVSSEKTRVLCDSEGESCDDPFLTMECVFMQGMRGAKRL